jgi:predicted Zn finger-like uncharacterized protein
MSDLIIDCPSCGRKLRVPDDLLGKAVKCPTCEHTFQSTAEPQPTTPASASATPQTMGSDPAMAPVGSADQRLPEELQDPEEEDARPWSEPQQFQGRRDAEPHRGTLILVLGIVSIVCSTLGACFAGLGGLIGLPLGIAAWVMGRRDLIKMTENLMDSQGKELTKAGWICGIIGTIMGSLCSLGFLVYLGFIFTMFNTARKMPPPLPAPAPAPVRPAPPPAPGPPGNPAADMRPHLEDYAPAAKA